MNTREEQIEQARRLIEMGISEDLVEVLEKNEIKLLEVGDNGVSTPAKYRNRFEKWQIHTQWKDTYLWYDRAKKRWNLHDMNGAQFIYVHELQHALGLAGINKEIELMK